MAGKRRCVYQGLPYKKNGEIRIICDKTLETHPKAYCYKKCKDYDPWKKPGEKHDQS